MKQYNGKCRDQSSISTQRLVKNWNKQEDATTQSTILVPLFAVHVKLPGRSSNIRAHQTHNKSISDRPELLYTVSFVFHAILNDSKIKSFLL